MVRSLLIADADIKYTYTEEYEGNRWQYTLEQPNLPEIAGKEYIDVDRMCRGSKVNKDISRQN